MPHQKRLNRGLGMSDLKDKFEETKTYQYLKNWIFDFDEERQYYYCLDNRYSHEISAINGAWSMFQELNK